MKTTKKLINEGEISKILKSIVEQTYVEAKEEELLLCLECSDIDLEIATSNNFEFEEAIKANFELDEFGEIIDVESYRDLLYELHDYFVELHMNSGLFDYFPEGEYLVQNKKLFSDSDILAPKGMFYAPFETARIE